MPTLCALSDCELVTRLSTLVEAERHAMADVIEHLVEMERRRLYLRLSVSSLYRYCIERLGYNLENARQIFGEPHIETKIRAKTPPAAAGATEPEPSEPRSLETPAKVLLSLINLGFARKEASAAVGQLLCSEPGLDVEQLLRKCLLLLIPKAS